MESCGNISNIDCNKPASALKQEDIFQIRNYQEKLCQGVLLDPSFDELYNLIDGEDHVISNKRKELKIIREKIENNENILLPEQVAALELEADTIELFIGYVLPADTMNFLTAWAMGNDISDIKKLSRQQLLEAAFLAKAGNDNPSDHLSGIFTDHNKLDIDRYAWTYYHEWEEDTMIARKHKGKKTVGGPKGRKF
jgi:hypothetical protein